MDLQATKYIANNYMKLSRLSAYSGLSVRKLRDLIKDPDCPLPSFRLHGIILVRKSDFDRWMEQNFRWKGSDIDEIVDEVMSELR